MSEQEVVEARIRAEEALGSGNYEQAQLWLRRIWRTSQTAGTANWILRRCDAFPEYYLSRQHATFERAFTIEPLLPLIRATAAVERVAVDAQLGPFNAYTQRMLDPDSELYSKPADIVFLSLLTRCVAPEFVDPCPPADETDVVIERVVDEVARLVAAFRSHSAATLVISGLDLPSLPALGFADSSRADSPAQMVRQINIRVAQIAAAHPGVYVHDLEDLLRRFGAERAFDEVRWETMRWPFTSGFAPVLAEELSRMALVAAGVYRKVLVVDLDDTLWGGVLGEEGADGIRMGALGRGAPHRALQRVLLSLFQRGVLLAVCSKNDHDHAWGVIESHPDMLLRPEHFAAVRINWQPKAGNLVEIANELNVGVDALAFLDDNPAEQDAIRAILPDIRVLDFRDPLEVAELVRRDPSFERLVLSADDRRRGEMYAQQRSRLQVQASATDLDSWLHSLGTEITRVSESPAMLERVAQLTQKTNQFNLTTRRYSVAEISALAARESHDVAAFQVADRFGDSGIVGVVILSHQGTASTIDTLLLSCRVIGRGVETAILSWAAERSIARGSCELFGQFIATDRNGPCSGFLERHGFISGSGDLVRLSLDSDSLPTLPSSVAFTDSAA